MIRRGKRACILREILILFDLSALHRVRGVLVYAIQAHFILSTGALIHGLVLEYLDALQLDATISVLKSEVGEVSRLLLLSPHQCCLLIYYRWCRLLPPPCHGMSLHRRLMQILHLVIPFCCSCTINPHRFASTATTIVYRHRDLASAAFTSCSQRSYKATDSLSSSGVTPRCAVLSIPSDMTYLCDADRPVAPIAATASSTLLPR